MQKKSRPQKGKQIHNTSSTKFREKCACRKISVNSIFLYFGAFLLRTNFTPAVPRTVGGCSPFGFSLSVLKHFLLSLENDGMQKKSRPQKVKGIHNTSSAKFREKCACRKISVNSIFLYFRAFLLRTNFTPAVPRTVGGYSPFGFSLSVLKHFLLSLENDGM